MSNEDKHGDDRLRDNEAQSPETNAEATRPEAANTPKKKCCGGCQRGKLHSFNWLEDIPGGYADSDLVEVQFKNTRKGFYRNSAHLPLEIGDVVAVEASPGHDIGTVTLTGKLVELSMRRAGVRSGTQGSEIKRVFRKAKPADIEKFDEARAREHDTMIRARRIADDLKLNMKIGDVEYQGDGNKAIFYYIADERVDFRQLIKVLRPLCCASWMTSFVSVGTSAARYQDISLNPQKLAGQCAKLKCCLNFEVDTYVEASKKMPPREVRLETADATYFHFKSDIFNRLVTYSTDKSLAANLVTIDADRVFEIIAMNKAGEKPLTLMREADVKPKEKGAFGDILGDDDLTRFDNKKKKRKNKKKPKPEGAQEQEKAATQPQKPQQEQPSNKARRPKKPKGGQQGPKKQQGE